MEVSPAAAAQGSAANGMSATSFTSIEPERVVEHLAAVCQIALGATQQDLEQYGNLLHKSQYNETISRCTRFANEAQNVLYIQKDIAQSSTVDNGPDSTGWFSSRLVPVRRK